ncbi:MAG: hypothetical protein AB7S86_17620 [Hydrogenophaga sp.]|uniref:hypothetical protein n=1 Tax=Hydrogenophaga sp. TaxID=1904254 RepID=UPI003D0D3A35
MPLFSAGRVPVCRLSTGLIAVLALSACSPTFNWRELRPQGTPLKVLMPCKPEHASRTVPLAGSGTEMHLHSCDTGGLSFAVAWVDLRELARVDAALVEWPRASLASLRLAPEVADAAQARWDFQMPGAPKALGLSVQGTGPQGQAVLMRAAYFARGTQVFQAAVYGPQLPGEVTATFFEALQLP